MKAARTDELEDRLDHIPVAANLRSEKLAQKNTDITIEWFEQCNLICSVNTASR